MKFRLPCQFQRIFILPNFVFVLINERYRILILASESCHRGGSLGAVVPSGSFLFEYGSVAYQIDGDDEQNRTQVIFFHPRVELVTLG